MRCEASESVTYRLELADLLELEAELIALLGKGGEGGLLVVGVAREVGDRLPETLGRLDEPRAGEVDVLLKGVDLGLMGGHLVLESSPLLDELGEICHDDGLLGAHVPKRHPRTLVPLLGLLHPRDVGSLSTLDGVDLDPQILGLVLELKSSATTSVRDGR